MTRVLGIDPGLTRLGLGVVELLPGRKVEFNHVEVLTTAPQMPLESRLLKLGQAIERILDAEVKPAAIAIERVFAQENLPSVMGVAQISGIVLYLAAARQIPVKFYTPSEIKSRVTGYGAADKSQVTAMVTKILGLQQPPKPADAADALAIAIAHSWEITRLGQARGGIALPSTGLTAAQRVWQQAEAAAKRKSRGSKRPVA